MGEGTERGAPGLEPVLLSPTVIAVCKRWASASWNPPESSHRGRPLTLLLCGSSVQKASALGLPAMGALCLPSGPCSLLELLKVSPDGPLSLPPFGLLSALWSL